MSGRVSRRQFVRTAAVIGVTAGLGQSSLRAFASTDSDASALNLSNASSHFLVAGMKHTGRAILPVGAIPSVSSATPLESVAVASTAHALISPYATQLSRSYLRTITIGWNNPNGSFSQQQSDDLTRLVLGELRDHSSNNSDEVWSKALRNTSKVQMIKRAARAGSSFGAQLTQFSLRRVHNVFYRNEGQQDPTPNWSEIEAHADHSYGGRFASTLKKVQASNVIPVSPFAEVVHSHAGRITQVKA